MVRKTPKYRLVKQTYASGYVQWNIQKKFLWWWEFVDGYWDERKARKTFETLQSGVPYKSQTVVAKSGEPAFEPFNADEAPF